MNFCFDLPRSDPEYFNVVSNPIDLLRVQSKIKMDEYDTVEQLTSDIHLLVSNAKAYYKVSVQCCDCVICRHGGNTIYWLYHVLLSFLDV